MIITTGLKRPLIRRQQRRWSYLSQVHLPHLSCTLITAVVRGAPRIVFVWGEKAKFIYFFKTFCDSLFTRHCCRAPCDVFVIRFKNRIKSCMGGVGGGGNATWGLAGRRSLVDVQELIREKATLMQKREILRSRRVPPVHLVQFKSGIFSLPAVAG